MKFPADQIELVLEWCQSIDVNLWFNQDDDSEWSFGLGDWDIVGIIASACKLADIKFNLSPCSDGWSVEISDIQKTHTNPSYAAFLAAYAIAIKTLTE